MLNHVGDLIILNLLLSCPQYGGGVDHRSRYCDELIDRWVASGSLLLANCATTVLIRHQLVDGNIRLPSPANTGGPYQYGVT